MKLGVWKNILGGQIVYKNGVIVICVSIFDQNFNFRRIFFFHFWRNFFWAQKVPSPNTQGQWDKVITWYSRFNPSDSWVWKSGKSWIIFLGVKYRRASRRRNRHTGWYLPPLYCHLCSNPLFYSFSFLLKRVFYNFILKIL